MCYLLHHRVIRWTRRISDGSFISEGNQVGHSVPTAAFAKGSRRRSHSRGLNAPPRKRNAHQPPTAQTAPAACPRSHEQVLTLQPASGRLRRVRGWNSYVKELSANPSLNPETTHNVVTYLTSGKIGKIMPISLESLETDAR